MPPYVLIGYPNVTRGPGFLGPKAGYVYLTDTASGPAGLTRPPGITDERQARREASARQRCAPIRRTRNPATAHRAITTTRSSEGFQLQGGDFMSAFDLGEEPGSLRADATATNSASAACSRAGSSSAASASSKSGFNLNFVNGTGWDTHNAAQKQQHELIQRLDQGVAALDRRSRAAAACSTRRSSSSPPSSAGPRSSTAAAAAAITASASPSCSPAAACAPGRPSGTTDELAMKIVDEPVSVPDLFATILATMGMNPAKNLMDGERPVPITDNGTPIAKLFA